MARKASTLPRLIARLSAPLLALLLAPLLASLLAIMVTLFWLPLAAQAENQKLATGRSGQGSGVEAEPLPNFHEVHPFLYRGGQPSSEGVDKLHKLGVKTVIDLRAETAATRKEKAQVERLGMQYIILPMSDAAPSQKQVDTFIVTVKEGQCKSEPVYVHCAHGSDRTGCMVGIWRVSQDNFSWDQAYKEMKKYYFGPKFTQLSGAVKNRATK